MKGDDGLEEEGLRSQEKESVGVGGGLLVLSFEFNFYGIRSPWQKNKEFNGEGPCPSTREERHHLVVRPPGGQGSQWPELYLTVALV